MNFSIIVTACVQGSKVKLAVEGCFTVRFRLPTDKSDFFDLRSKGFPTAVISLISMTFLLFYLGLKLFVLKLGLKEAAGRTKGRSIFLFEFI